MPPADELHAAAAQLRHHAETAHRVSPGPWAHDHECAYSSNGLIVADRSCASDNGHPEQVRDLPYIALMDPAVGLALAAWLEEIAATHYRSTHPGDDHTECWCGDDAAQCRMIRHALAVARAILDTQETP
ncbi:hypothetical protein [Streptomyces sp. NPDC058045]|uniref:hypothetical protein n=1 Tax=Streptomyces sp. NPDC058045 TaxID=3346311 RepID=UPI0036E9FE12